MIIKHKSLKNMTIMRKSAKKKKINKPIRVYLPIYYLAIFSTPIH